MIWEQHSTYWWEDILSYCEDAPIGSGLGSAEQVAIRTHSQAGFRWQDFPHELDSSPSEETKTFPLSSFLEFPRFLL